MFGSCWLNGYMETGMLSFAQEVCGPEWFQKLYVWRQSFNCELLSQSF